MSNATPETPQQRVIKNSQSAVEFFRREGLDTPLLDAIREIGVIRPGDTLILSAPDQRLTREDAEHITTEVERLIPGVNVVVIGLPVTIMRVSDEEIEQMALIELADRILSATKPDPLPGMMSGYPSVTTHPDTP